MHQNLNKKNLIRISSWATPRGDMHPLPLSTHLTHMPIARMDTVIKAVMLSGCDVGRAVDICADDIESSYVGDTSMIRFNLYAGFIFNAIYNYFNGL